LVPMAHAGGGSGSSTAVRHCEGSCKQQPVMAQGAAAAHGADLSCAVTSGATAHLQDGSQQHLLSQLLAMSCRSAPLPPLDYPRLLQQQLELPWIAVHRQVIRSTRLVRPPAVLVLQLQRAAVSPTGHGTKLQGAVTFPLVLDVGQGGLMIGSGDRDDKSKPTACAAGPTAAGEVVAGVGVGRRGSRHIDEDVHEASGGCAHPGDALLSCTGDGGGCRSPRLPNAQEDDSSSRLGDCSRSRSRCGSHTPLYDLIAVVQHVGVEHTSGHYIMYRRVAALTAATTTAAPHGGAAADGVRVTASAGDGVRVSASIGLGSGSSSSSSSPGIWFRVSDSSVQPVEEADVLQCSATLLVYECRSRGKQAAMT
jgi:hypothetical protein